MKTNIKVPGVGESITEGFLATWLVSDGSVVTEGQSLFELETDKTTIDGTAPADGILSITVPEGKDVVIDQIVGFIDSNAAEPVTHTPEPQVDLAKNVSSRVTPAAKSKAQAAGISTDTMHGSGRKGMVTKFDVKEQIASKKPDDVSTEKPSVPGGNRKPMSRIRQAIARNLAQTRNELVLLTTFNEVDMTGVKALRQSFGAAFLKRHNVKLGFMSFFLKASAHALENYPEVNARIDSTTQEIVYPDGIHISVAVSTPKGLVTPVLRNVQDKNFAEIEASIVNFSQKAEKKTLLPDDLIGGTFTVTNGGIFGSMMSTPLPAPNQSAILGMHAIQEKPVVCGGEVVIRPMMYLALSYDHRLIDGREAVGCLKTIKDSIENPERLLLGL